MTIAQRFPYAALAAPFDPDDRDRFATRLMGSRVLMSIEHAASIAAYICKRKPRRTV